MQNSNSTSIIIRVLRFFAPVVAFIMLWQLLSKAGALSANILPEPYMVASDIVAWARSGELLEDTYASMMRVVEGFCGGALLAILIGVMMSVWKSLNYMFEPIVEVLRPIPPLAWIPLSILWFGLGDSAAAFLVSLGAFFPVYTGVRRGLIAIDPRTLEIADLYEISFKRRINEIVIPQAMPYVVSGIIIGLGISWMIVITAELVGAQNGLGYAIQVARLQLDSKRVISGMLVIGLVGFSINYIATRIESYFYSWKKEIGDE